MKKMMFALLILVGCGGSVETAAPPPCNHCQAVMLDHEKIENVCEDSVNRYSNLYACVCDGLHVAPYPCQDWCSTATSMSAQCLGVIESECFEAYSVCDADK